VLWRFVLRHIRLAEMQCFDPKVSILTFAFVRVYYAFTTLVTRVAKETSTTRAQKIFEVAQSESCCCFENS
jgi:hypothetical protein